MPPEYVYHLTHIHNLPSIVSRGLQSDATVAPTYTCIGDVDIKTSRKLKQFTGSNGESRRVSEYIPFYFAPRSPMLYKIHKGGVEGYTGTQNDIIYLVCRRSVLWNTYECCGTDQNAATSLADFYFDDESLCQNVDWDVMVAEMWNNTFEFPDRMQKRMAEFLVYSRVDFKAVEFVAVVNKHIYKEVQKILYGLMVDCPITVKPEWYY